MSGPLMQIDLAYLVSRNSRSWPSGQPLADACKVTDASGGIDVHHIFPRKFVGHVECDFDVNTMGNYAILTHPDNAALGDAAPKVAYGAFHEGDSRPQACDALTSAIHIHNVPEYPTTPQSRPQDIQCRSPQAQSPSGTPVPLAALVKSGKHARIAPVQSKQMKWL